MKYWIFKVNPKLYRIDDRLKDPNPETTWRVSRYKEQIRPGDIAFLWQTGTDRGICGVMRINTSPRIMEEIPVEMKYYVNLDAGATMRVCGELLH